MKWNNFPRYWPLVRGIHRCPVNSPHKVQWRGVLIFSLICLGINGWVNNREAGDLRRYGAHYDVSVMMKGSRFIFPRIIIWCRVVVSTNQRYFLVKSPIRFPSCLALINLTSRQYLNAVPDIIPTLWALHVFVVAYPTNPSNDVRKIVRIAEVKTLVLHERCSYQRQ